MSLFFVTRVACQAPAVAFSSLPSNLATRPPQSLQFWVRTLDLLTVRYLTYSVLTGKDHSWSMPSHQTKIHEYRAETIEPWTTECAAATLWPGRHVLDCMHHDRSGQNEKAHGMATKDRKRRLIKLRSDVCRPHHCMSSPCRMTERKWTSKDQKRQGLYRYWHYCNEPSKIVLTVLTHL